MVVVVFVSLGRCSTISRCLYLLLRVLGASIMLRRSCVRSKGLVSLERCSTISCCLYLLLRVLGAGY
ncbi:hypothetical protein HBH98_137620 [Parastagonospora nodorum]|nr:hypothetical protein HBH98_137620 [Parastagonospora nodorum]KAH4393914.1 hypothetical protein HBH97_035140 [Parastagonospora nodorum]KAH4423936.1 hypothetical protein HBH99_046820 [Parastagonospora nodorum]